MKKINNYIILYKNLLVSLIIIVFIFSSCKNEDSIIDTVQEANQSTSLVIAMGELASHFNDEGVLIEGENPVGNILFDFCFDFVYPITLVYNNDSQITIENFEGLIAILTSQSETLFVNGIAFPFQVEVLDEDGIMVIQTISNETDFLELLENCDFDFDCDCNAEFDPVCVEILVQNGESFIVEFPNTCYAECEGFTKSDYVDCEGLDTGGEFINDCFIFNYPISLISEGITTVINSNEEFDNYIFSTSNNSFDFVYPFNVTLVNDSVLTISNETDFVDLLVLCDGLKHDN
jgi:hypothetical protein